VHLKIEEKSLWQWFEPSYFYNGIGMTTIWRSFQRLQRGKFLMQSQSGRHFLVAKMIKENNNEE